jgi:outer membrane protein assembly factor BamB
MVASVDGTNVGVHKFLAANGFNVASGFPAGTDYASNYVTTVTRILNDQVYVAGNTSQIYRRESDGTAEISSSSVVNAVRQLIVVRDNNDLFVSPQTNVLYRLNAGLGNTVWADGKSGNLGGLPTSGAMYMRAEAMVYVGVGNQLYRLNVSDGAVQSNWPIPGSDQDANIVTLPVQWKTFVYFGTDDGRIFAVHRTSNVARANWPITLNEGGTAPVLRTAVIDTVNSRVYFSSAEGRVYRFALE